MSAPDDCPLICTFVNPESPKNVLDLSFRRDAEKKSAFWLEDGEHTMAEPAHCIIMGETTFALGGFQLVSNARTVEIYLVEAKNEADEEVYLTTCRGVPSDGIDNYKVTCVIPGGPRAVTTLHLKLLGLKPNKTDTARLSSIKLTARLPEQENSVAAPANSTSSQQVDTHHSPAPANRQQMRLPPQISAVANNPSSPTALTGEDLGSAMAGLSFLVRSTQDTLLSTMKQSQQELKVGMDQQLLQLQQQVQQIQISQQRLLEQQGKMMQQQAEAIERQQKQLATVVEDNRKLYTLVNKQAECRLTNHFPDFNLHDGERQVDGQVPSSLSAIGVDDDDQLAENGHANDLSAIEIHDDEDGDDGDAVINNSIEGGLKRHTEDHEEMISCSRVGGEEKSHPLDESSIYEQPSDDISLG